MGKTVAIKQPIKALLDSGKPVNSIARISAEGWTTHKLEDFQTSTPLPPIPEGSSRYWFIDEISSINRRWDQLIKELRDENPEFRAATVVLTGSNAALLAEAAGTLARRRGKGVGQDRILLPMGFATFGSLVKSRARLPKSLARRVSETLGVVFRVRRLSTGRGGRESRYPPFRRILSIPCLTSYKMTRSRQASWISRRVLLSKRRFGGEYQFHSWLQMWRTR